jgi:hypothetical protein
MLELVYKTEKTVGDGTKDDVFRTVYQFWKREGDQFILICEYDTLKKL